MGEKWVKSLWVKSLWVKTCGCYLSFFVFLLSRFVAKVSVSCSWLEYLLAFVWDVAGAAIYQTLDFFPCNIFCVRSALPSVAFRRNPLTHTHIQLHTQTTYSHTTYSHTHTTLSHTQLSITHSNSHTHTHNALPHTHTHTLCSRRGTYGTGLPLLVRLGPVAVCVAGVAFGSVDVHSVWQAWHLVTSTSLCLAGVALIPGQNHARPVPAAMPPPESGARERLGGPASPADQGLQARENQPADG